MNISEKYVTILGQKKTELENYVKESIGGIELPEQVAVSNHRDDQRPQSMTASYILGGGGLAMAIGGMASDKLVLAVVGFVVTGGGVVWYVKNKRAKQLELQQNVQDYSRITSKVYSALSSIQRNLFEGWDNCTATIKSQIKSDIYRLNISEDVRNQAIQSVLNTSIIEISMLNVSQTLGKIEQKGDYAAYRQYLCSFEQDCLKAIQKAFDEQVHIYNNLNSII